MDRGADEVIGSVPAVLLYFSTSAGVELPGVAGSGDDADIYSWNGVNYARVFDASVAGLPDSADIDALLVVDADTFYMSFKDVVDPPGPLGNVEDEDIVLYDAGVWSLYFDGSDVGLGDGGSDEDVDAFEILPNGRLLISTLGNGSVPGVGGFKDEDLLRCTGTFGPATTCTWAVYFEGSDVALTARLGECRRRSVAGANIYLSTIGDFDTGGGNVGQGADVFVCIGATTGAATSCATSACTSTAAPTASRTTWTPSTCPEPESAWGASGARAPAAGLPSERET